MPIYNSYYPKYFEKDMNVGEECRMMSVIECNRYHPSLTIPQKVPYVRFPMSDGD